MSGPRQRSEIAPFPWAEVMTLGLCRLRLPPDVFWSLTPKELLLIAGLGSRNGDVLNRDGLVTLMRRFPDAPPQSANTTDSATDSTPGHRNDIASKLQRITHG